MGDRPLSAEEARLWARLVATVEPLEKLQRPPAHLSAPAKAEALRHADRKPEAALRPAPEHKRATAPPPPNTLDGSWDRRLARGLVSPELAVDLHGHSLDTAYRTLDAGLEAAIARGVRVLLLITGKPRDRASGRGAIRAAVGDWLAASRHAADIAAVRGAHPRHGGPGALYIVLRRDRTRGR
ncbi:MULTISPECIES: Smr/MutS family protein [Sphingomonas]|uniref:Smr/MutS family protein n=1 Tax=Sphingomonas TaxID=13687 RepID=UPI0028680E29|nr:Smr/MutS family protein [Sphingomonas sp. CGMCC 1.13658]